MSRLPLPTLVRLCAATLTVLAPARLAAQETPAAQPSWVTRSQPLAAPASAGAAANPASAAATGPMATASSPASVTSSQAGTPAFASSALTRESLLSTVTHDLTAHFNLTDELAVDFVRPWTPPSEPDAAVTIVEFPPVLAPSILLRVRYSQAGGILREETLTLRAQLWRDACVPRSPLDRGTALSAEAVEIRRVDALRERDALPASAAQDEYLLTRAVPAARLLTWRDVARRPLVRKGAMIEVSASDGPMIITLKAIAMQDGAQGDTVRLRNPESKREFSALVTAENRARVNF